MPANNAIHLSQMIDYVRNVRGGGRALLGEEKEVTVALLEEEGMTDAVLGGEEEGVAGAAPELEVEEVAALKGGGGE